MLGVTPLHELHAALGASFTGFAGRSMPLWYGSGIAAHRAVRNVSGVFDLNHMGQIEVTGLDAGAALDYAVVGQPSAIGVNRARYSMVCRDDGGVMDDVIIYRIAQDAFLVVCNAANATVVVRALYERAAGFKAAIEDLSATRALLAIQGPRAAEILGDCTDADIGVVRYYGIVDATVAGSPVMLGRTGYTGEDGFEIFCASGDAAAIWTALLKVGESRGLFPAGLASRGTLRLDAGMTLYGHELSFERTPYEAGLGRLVAFNKAGGFVGRESLAFRAQAGPEQVLVGLVSGGRRSPRQGCQVRTSEGGDVIGEVTSGSFSPTLAHPVAMAYVSADSTTPGRDLTVDVRGRAHHARVAELPFYRCRH